MTFGYLIIVNTDAEHDYLKMAYALALSIKNTQRQGFDKVALVINDDRRLKNLKSSWVFDHVINYQSENRGWDERSWMDKHTPFDYTVCLDADMLFTRDYSHWIEYFIENTELYIANKSYTYRDELVTTEEYRRAFINNHLPNFYSFYVFFKKDSQMVTEFFDLGRTIIKNQKEFSNNFLSEYKPKIIGTDEALALSAKILDIADGISFDLEFPKIVHMKPLAQNWPWPANKWSDHVGFYLNRKGQLKIGNYQQYNIVHYVEKDKIDDEMINILEEIAWKK